MKKGNQMVGTLRYASISNHKGFEQSRRDDLESIGYVLVYFLMGSLPWQSIQAVSVKDKIEMIKNKKNPNYQVLIYANYLEFLSTFIKIIDFPETGYL